jgi:hypothetical protein
MKEAPTGKAAGPAHDHGGLPHDHPPIGGESRPAAGATAPASGRGAPASAPASGDLAARLKAIGLAAKVPAGWVEEPGQRPMRLATVRIPRQGGDTEDGEMSVSEVGGSLEANVERWRGQFQEKPEPVLLKKEAAGLEVTTVEMGGTFADSMRGGPAKPGTKLLGAIVKVPGADSLVFFKAWGPQRTMEEWKPSFEEFVASLAPAR